MQLGDATESYPPIRRFVTGHDGEVATPLPTDQMHIAVADRGRGETDFHFARLRWIDLDFFDAQGLTKCVTYRGFHHSLLSA